jgi:hypothetical protein
MIPQEAESRFIRRQRREMLRIPQSSCLVVALTGLLLLIGRHHCSAYEGAYRYRGLVDVAVPLTDQGELLNSTLAETTLEPTPMPTPEPTLSTTDPLPVLLTPAPSDQGKVTAFFHLYFQIEGGPLTEGYMNATQIVSFQGLMATLPDYYLPLEIREVTPVFCEFKDQMFLDSGLETFEPFPPQFDSMAPSQTPGGLSTTLQPTAGPDAQTRQTAGAPANRNFRWLGVLGLSKLANAFGEQPTGPGGMSKQSKQQGSSTAVSNQPKETIGSRRMQQLPPGSFIVNGTQIYVYYFQMEFSSASETGLANLTQRPVEFADYIIENGGNVSMGLAQILGVDSPERLEIFSIFEADQISDAPSVAPSLAPSGSFAPSSGPTVSSAPSVSPQPSQNPSIPPTSAPSSHPTAAPSSLPTFGINSTAVDNYDVTFVVQAPSQAGYMNESQEAEFCFYMENQTAVFAPEAVDRVVTNCTFLGEALIGAQVPITLSPSSPVTQEGNTVTTPANETRRRTRFLLRRQPPPRISSRNSTLSGVRTRPYDNRTNTTRSYLLLPVPQPPSTQQTQRRIQEEFLLEQPNNTYIYSFRMRYTSDTENVENFTADFFNSLLAGASWFNPMLTDVLNLNESHNLQIISAQTFQTKSSAPSQSPAPSESPTLYPTEFPPTLEPTSSPTDLPTPTGSPTKAPIIAAAGASVNDATAPPESNNSGGVNGTTLVIVVLVVALGSLASLVGLAWFYKTRQSKMQQLIMENMNTNEEQSGRDGGAGGQSKNQTSSRTTASGALRSRYDDTVATVPLSHSGEGAMGAPLQVVTGHDGHLVMAPSNSESILSNPSLLSNGQGDDEVDVDLVGHDHPDSFPPDDFDRFKDQNLEKMRSHVEDNVTGMDGMMSQALTHALMPGGDNASLLWSGAQEAMEIEANALWEVTDWMKKSEFALVDEK